MSDELDRRAALAMGWKETGISPIWETKTGESRWLGYIEGWSPSTDRNDLAELLREVERRGLAHDFEHAFFRTAGWIYVFGALTADPAVICAAACEVLEEK